MKVQVYHLKNTKMVWCEPTTEFDPELFEHVANVDVGDEVFTSRGFDSAFYYTNSIDSYWGNTDKEFVEVIGKNHRSTSVGDVMVVDGIAYTIGNVGFHNIPWSIK